MLLRELCSFLQVLHHYVGFPVRVEALAENASDILFKEQFLEHAVSLRDIHRFVEGGGWVPAKHDPRADDWNGLVEESIQLGVDGASCGGKWGLGVALLEPLTDVQESSALRAEADHVKISEIPALEEQRRIAGHREVSGREVEDKNKEFPGRIFLHPPFDFFDEHPKVVDDIATRLLHVDRDEDNALLRVFRKRLEDFADAGERGEGGQLLVDQLLGVFNHKFLED